MIAGGPFRRSLIRPQIGRAAQGRIRSPDGPPDSPATSGRSRVDRPPWPAAARIGSRSIAIRKVTKCWKYFFSRAENRRFYRVFFACWHFQTISPVSASSASVELWYMCWLSAPLTMNFGAGEGTDVPMNRRFSSGS